MYTYTMCVCSMLVHPHIETLSHSRIRQGERERDMETKKRKMDAHPGPMYKYREVWKQYNRYTYI